MKTSTLFRLLAFGALSWCPAGAATTVVLDKAAAAIAQITPTEMIFPGGAPNFYPALFVGGDTTAGGSPSRLVFEFSLAGIAEAGGTVQHAEFSATAFGGARGMGTLRYALFGYAGTGMPDLTTGMAGTQVAGPFIYDIDFGPSANLKQLDVTGFVSALVASGATHAGFVFRDVNTAANFRTDQQYIVVQNSPSWGGDIPAGLSLTVVPEPQVCQLMAVVVCAAALRRRRGHG